MTDNLQFAVEAAWKVLLVGLVLGAGLPAVFTVGVRSMAWGAGGSAEVDTAARPNALGPTPRSPSASWSCWPASGSASPSSLAAGGRGRSSRSTTSTRPSSTSRSDRGVLMPLNTRLAGVLDWLREGYPAGVPPKDYIPLLALFLRRTLTEDEVREIAGGDRRARQRQPRTAQAEIGVQITKLTDAMPSPEDITRVEARLASHHGWDAAGPEDEPALFSTLPERGTRRPRCGSRTSCCSSGATGCGRGRARGRRSGRRRRPTAARARRRG